MIELQIRSIYTLKLRKKNFLIQKDLKTDRYLESRDESTAIRRIFFKSNFFLQNLENVLYTYVYSYINTVLKKKKKILICTMFRNNL